MNHPPLEAKRDAVALIRAALLSDGLAQQVIMDGYRADASPLIMALGELVYVAFTSGLAASPDELSPLSWLDGVSQVLREAEAEGGIP